MTKKFYSSQLQYWYYDITLTIEYLILMGNNSSQQQNVRYFYIFI